MQSEEERHIVRFPFEDAQVVALSGEWDVASRQQLRVALERVSDGNVIVDLRQATFFDSTALAELIALYKRVNAGGHRVEALVGASNMRRLLELTSLDGLLGVSPERGEYLNENLPSSANRPNAT